MPIGKSINLRKFSCFHLTIVCDVHYNELAIKKEVQLLSENIIDGLVQELRRGSLVLCVLSALSEPRYGYSLVQSLSESGISVDAGTLYPLLRRLEKQELLKSEWETSSQKPRKYYERTRFGDTVYAELLAQWDSMSASIKGLVGKE